MAMLVDRGIHWLMHGKEEERFGRWQNTGTNPECIYKGTQVMSESMKGERSWSKFTFDVEFVHGVKMRDEREIVVTSKSTSFFFAGECPFLVKRRRPV